jgi:hypothetical protein
MRKQGDYVVIAEYAGTTYVYSGFVSHSAAAMWIVDKLPHLRDIPPATKIVCAIPVECN